MSKNKGEYYAPVQVTVKCMMLVDGVPASVEFDLNQLEAPTPEHVIRAFQHSAAAARQHGEVTLMTPRQYVEQLAKRLTGEKMAAPWAPDQWDIPDETLLAEPPQESGTGDE